ncbi:MAG TPA: hypothetical protein PLV95_00340 [Candidatus Pacearchaeota archaeon]|nr:hypothetical protein [Candidatus Pacearchaeota archaeon]
MDLNEIRKIIKEEKAKVVLVDSEGTSLIILDYEEYKKMKESEEEKREMSEELEDEPLKIEDLPF